VQLRERLAHAVAESAGGAHRGALLCLDLDNFKTINDSLGHSVGDAVLQAVADRLRGLVRTGDLVARLGGDEFVLVCEALPAADHARQVAERILEQLGQPIETPGGEVRIGASIGIALSHGDDNPTSLIRQADMAMYRAKAEGRNRACFDAAAMLGN